MIVAGVGFRGVASLESLQQAFAAAQLDLQVEVAVLATLEDKAHDVPFMAFAQALDLPVITVAQDELSDVDTPTQSHAVRAARETGSVAEAVALTAAGPGATLLQNRVISEDRCATCAIAQSGATEVEA